MKSFKKTLSCCVISISMLSACGDSTKICFSFDDNSYSVNDTIYADANCSENVSDYDWTPGEGMQMIGNGYGATEAFLITELNGTLSRTVNLSVSNDN